jgi:hypothetical protein
MVRTNACTAFDDGAAREDARCHLFAALCDLVLHNLHLWYCLSRRGMHLVPALSDRRE